MRLHIFKKCQEDRDRVWGEARRPRALRPRGRGGHGGPGRGGPWASGPTGPAGEAAALGAPGPVDPSWRVIDLRGGRKDVKAGALRPQEARPRPHGIEEAMEADGAAPCASEWLFARGSRRRTVRSPRAARGLPAERSCRGRAMAELNGQAGGPVPPGAHAGRAPRASLPTRLFPPSRETGRREEIFLF